MTLDDEQEDIWARERSESLDRWIEGRARSIAALPTPFERRMALEQYEHGKPTRIRERLDKRVMELWKLGRG